MNLSSLFGAFLKLGSVVTLYLFEKDVKMICYKISLILLLCCKIPPYHGANIMMPHIPSLSLGQGDILVWNNIRWRVKVWEDSLFDIVMSAKS